MILIGWIKLVLSRYLTVSLSRRILFERFNCIPSAHVIPYQLFCHAKPQRFTRKVILLFIVLTIPVTTVQFLSSSENVRTMTESKL